MLIPGEAYLDCRRNDGIGVHNGGRLGKFRLIEIRSRKF